MGFKPTKLSDAPQLPATAITVLHDGQTDEVLFSITGGPIQFDKLRAALQRVIDWSIIYESAAQAEQQAMAATAPISIPGAQPAHD